MKRNEMMRRSNLDKKLDAIETELGALSRNISALRCLAALNHPERVLLKANFNPNESRVPAGTPDGDQWTAGGGGGNGANSNRRGSARGMIAQAFGSDVDRLPQARKVTSENGRQFIALQEGVRHKIYQDTAGNATVGVGHKLTAAEAALLRESYSDTIPDGLIKFLFNSDLDRAERAVYDTIRNADRLSQNQFDALVSFAFNVGPKGFATSTLAKMINGGDMSEAASQFSRWVYAGGKFSSDLAKRRAAERSLFLGDAHDRK